MNRPSHRLPSIVARSPHESVEVEPLTQQQFPARPRDELIEILQAYPERPYLAHLLATNRSDCEDTLHDRILDHARHLGTDTVVLGRAYAAQTTLLDPRVRSTTSPLDSSSSVSVWDAGSIAQETADQSDWTLHLSAIAVRYEPIDAPSVFQINQGSE